MATFKARRAATIAVTVIAMLSLSVTPAAAASVKPNPRPAVSAKVVPNAALDGTYCEIGAAAPYLAGNSVSGHVYTYCSPHVTTIWEGWFKVWRKKAGYANVLVGMVDIPAPSIVGHEQHLYHSFGTLCASGWTYWVHAYAEISYDGSWGTLDVNSSNVVLC